MALNPALHSREEGLQQLLLTAPEAGFLSVGEVILAANRAAERLFGTPQHGLTSRPWREVIHPDSAAIFAEGTRTRGDGAGSLFEMKIVCADGSVRIVETGIAPMRQEGEAVIVLLRDVTELLETRVALAESHIELRRLRASQVDVQERERQRIAHELHDDLQQTIATIQMNLGAMVRHVTSPPAALTLLMEETREQAAAALESTRRIVNDLRPQVLEKVGLLPALEALAAQFARRTGIACRLDVIGQLADDAALSPRAATCLYRVAQESLHNAGRHSAATRVQLTFAAARNGSVVMRIVDNGCGIDLSRPPGPESLGLRGIHERVNALGALLRIVGEPNIGTTIEVTLPSAGALRLNDGNLQATPDIQSNCTAVQALIDASWVKFIEALDGNAAVIDHDGVILSVNAGWRHFSRAYDRAATDQATGLGANYLEVCRRSARNDPYAVQVLHGMTALLDGRSPCYECEYPCETGGITRWYRLRAAPLGQSRFLVTHTDLTARR